MANWNPNYNPAYGSGYQHPFYPDSTYSTASTTDERENGEQNTSYFARRQPTATTSGAEHYGQAGPWSAPTGPAYGSGALPYSRSLPFDYENQSLPVGMTQGYSAEAVSYANPATLSYCPEIPLSPQGEEEEEEEPPEIKSEEPNEPPPLKRKRGRPRLNRSEAEASKAAANSHRVPHNQVERKYRETLNAEMERLRVNIPSLPQSSGDSMMSPPKPSKATVLAAAVQYIKELEHDVEVLADENDDLRSGRPSRPGGRTRRRTGYP